MNAKLLVSAGAPDQRSGGAVSLPSQVWSSGMAPLWLKAEDWISNGICDLHSGSDTGIGIILCDHPPVFSTDEPLGRVREPLLAPDLPPGSTVGRRRRPEEGASGRSGIRQRASGSPHSRR